MTLSACAEIVRKGDPDRFIAAMAAPREARARLFPLYAFNLEIARAPWATADPLIAKMRLQFWRDALAEIDEGMNPRAHEVVKPLAGVMQWGGLPGKMLDAMVVARWTDVDREPLRTPEVLDAYLAETAGTLMWASAQALGAQYIREPTVRAVGKAQGLASMLVAAPELERRGWFVLPETGVPQMIDAARADIAEARTIDFKLSVPALRAAWRADGVLARAAKDPDAIREGRLEGSEIARRAGLAVRSITGRW